MLNTSSDLPSSEDKDRLINDIRKKIGNKSSVRNEKRLRVEKCVQF